MTEQTKPAGERKPWPMSAVAAAVVVFIVLYTAVTLAFRKPGPAHEPYAEAQQRANDLEETAMLEWTRFTAELGPVTGEPAAPTPAAPVTVQPTPLRLDKVLPVELVLVTPGQPSLYPRLARLAAPSAVPPGGSLRLGLQPPADAPAFGEAWIYAKENELHIFLQDDRNLPRNAAATPPAERMRLALRAGALVPGRWTASAYTGEETFSWSFVIE